MIKPDLSLDSRELEAPNGSLRYAKNVVVTQDGIAIKNEDGFTNIITLDYNFIGKIELPDGFVIFSTNGTTSEIGIYRNNVYTTVMANNFLGFKLDCPIEGVYKYANNGDLIISWWNGIRDNSIPPFILNIDNPPTISNINDVNLIKLFPHFKVPRIDITSLGTGGNIKVGLYSFVLSYEFDTVNNTKWTGHTRFIPIDTPGTPTNHEMLNANNFGTNSNKSANIVIENLDTTFSYFRLGAIIQQNNSQEFIEIGRYPTGAGSTIINFIGQSIPTNVTVEEVTKDNLIFSKVKTGTINNNKLVLGNVVTSDLINLQPYANEIKVGWVSSEIDGNFYKDGTTVYWNKGFQPGEVYGLYMYATLKGGVTTEAFHIPGRVAKPMFIDPSGVNELINERDTLVDKAWFGYDPNSQTGQGVNIDSRVYHIFETATQDGFDTNGCPYGTMGYWENIDEKYPDTSDFDGSIYGSDIVGKNVRHHKFPNIATLHKNRTDSNIKFVLGLTFSNINIPIELQDKIEAIHFGFAKRTLDNRTVIGCSPLLPDTWYNDPPHTGIYYRTYDFKMLSSLDSTFVDHVFLEGYCSDVYTYPFMHFASPPGGGVPYLAGTIENQGLVANNIVPIKTTKYDEIGSVQHKDHLRLYDKSPYATPFVTHLAFTNILIGHIISYPYATLRRFRRNVYYGFAEQEIIPLGYSFNPNITSIDYYNSSSGTLNKRVHGGDTYLGLQRIFLEEGIDTDPLYETCRISPSVYTQYHLEERIAPSGFPTSPYNPTEHYNIFNYDIDWITLNKYMETFPYDTLSFRTNEFPYWICRSIVEPTDGLRENWRTFLPNNIYKMPSNKGEIWALNSINKTLVINQKYSMFIAYLKDKLNTLGTDTYVGVGDIFDRQPEELLGINHGYIGCESQFGITVFPNGILIPDRKQGKLFIYDGKQINEISNKDAKLYFKDNLNTDIDIDNPYSLCGIVSTFDDKWNRLIISKKDITLDDTLTFRGDYTPLTVIYNNGDIVYYNGVLYSIINNEGQMSLELLSNDSYTDTSFTISFNLKRNTFTSFHDYKPNCLFYNRNNSFAIDNKKIYSFNNTSLKATYFNSVVYDSFIDILFNTEPLNTKEIEMIEWVTEVIKSNNVKLYDETINKLMVYNETQCTGLLDVNTNNDWYDVSTGKTTYGTWYFNQIFDAVLNNKLPILDSNKLPISTNVNKNVKDFYENFEFISKFAILRLLYTNPEIDNTQRDIYIHNAEVKFIPNIIK